MTSGSESIPPSAPHPDRRPLEVAPHLDSDSDSRGSAPTPKSDAPAIAITAVAGALAGLHLATYLASIVVLPGTAPTDGVISWLSLPENSLTKSREIGIYTFAALLAPLLAWCGARISLRILERDSDAGIVLAPFFVAFVLVACEAFGLRSRGEGNATAGSATSWIAACFGGLALASMRRRILSCGYAMQRVAATRGKLPIALFTIVPTAIFLLSLGPRIAHDAPLALAGGRIAVLGLGLATILAGALAVSAGGGRTHTTPLSIAPSDPTRFAWPFVFLLGARFAPDDPRVVGISVGATLLGLGLEYARSRTTLGTSNPRGDLASVAWRQVDRILLPALVVVLVFQSNVDGDIDFFHEGEYLTPAFEALAGETPFVDVYLQHGLGRNVLRTLATFEWVDVTLAAERWSRNLFVALTHAAAFALMLAAFRSRVLALLVALMTSTPELALDWRFLFPLLALAFVARDLHVPRRGNLFASGVCGAIAFFVSTDLGVYTLVAIAFFLVLDGARVDAIAVRITRLRRFIVGAIVGAVPFSCLLASWGALDGALTNLRAQVGLQLSVWALPWTPLSDVFAGREALPDGRFADIIDSPTLLALVAALSYLAIPTWRWIAGFARTATPTARALTLLALAGVVTFRTALGRSDVGHLRFASIYALFLASGLTLAAFRVCWRSSMPGSLRVVLGAAPGALLMLYACSAYVPLYTLAHQWKRISAPPPARGLDAQYATPSLPHLGDVLIPIDQARALATLDALLCEELAPHQTFYDFSNAGALYALLGRRAPTRYFMAVYAATAEMQDEVIRDLERERPPLAFVATRIGEPTIDGFHADARAPRLAAYLERIYEEPRFVGIGYLAKRRLETKADSTPPAQDSRDR